MDPMLPVRPHSAAVLVSAGPAVRRTADHAARARRLDGHPPPAVRPDADSAARADPASAVRPISEGAGRADRIGHPGRLAMRVPAAGARRAVPGRWREVPNYRPAAVAGPLVAGRTLRRRSLGAQLGRQAPRFAVCIIDHQRVLGRSQWIDDLRRVRDHTVQGLGIVCVSGQVHAEVRGGLVLDHLEIALAHLGSDIACPLTKTIEGHRQTGRRQIEDLDLAAEVAGTGILHVPQ